MKNDKVWSRIVLLSFVLLMSCSRESEKQKLVGASRDTFHSGSFPDSGNQLSSSGSASTIIEPHIPVEEMTKHQRDAYVTKLRAAGRYNCCLESPCTACLYEDEHCACAAAVKSNDPVCGECYRGWQKGKGSVKGVKKEQIRRR